MDIRLICIDMDGTLLSPDHITVSLENIRAVKAALAAGIVVVPATGRILSRLSAQLAQLPDLDWAVLCNGAQVMRLADRTLIHNLTFTPEKALSLLELAKKERIPAMVYQGEEMLISCADLAMLQAMPHQRAHMAAFLKIQKPVSDFEAYLSQNPCDIVKVNLPFIEPAQRSRLLEEWRSLPGVEMTTSMDDNLELGPLGANKGAGVLSLCRHLGLSAEQAMVIGDGENDISMFKAAGWAVAMENACESAKAAANVITASNENDGVAKAIFSVLDRQR